MLELLPDAGLVGSRGDVLLEQGANLPEPFLLGLPRGLRRHVQPVSSPPPPPQAGNEGARLVAIDAGGRRDGGRRESTVETVTGRLFGGGEARRGREGESERDGRGLEV